jgi:predicted nucleic acid-binding protein
VTASALDTSLAVPYLVASHESHEVAAGAVPKGSVLTAQSLAETYAVLTRLPGDARVLPADAARLLDQNFGPPLALPGRLLRNLPEVLAELEVAGGQTYDALVGLAAREGGAVLLTADRRATATYRRLGVAFDLVALKL